MLIYLCFISLGLPDSMFGASWPVMRLTFGAPLEVAGIVSIMVSGGTVFSSLLSARVIRRFGTGKVTAVSVLATAVALLGFGLSHSFIWLLILAIPLGLGGGAVDAALNNYVALHYAARHMSWLHCFWGVGASVGPIIMASFLQQDNNWRGGYLTVAAIQIAVSILLFVSLPLWKDKRNGALATKEIALDATTPTKQTVKIYGVAATLVTFLFYCAIESSTGLWSSSFLVEARAFSVAAAARASAVFFGSITVGRLVTGFLTMRMKSQQLIRIGTVLVLGGAILYALPLPGQLPLVALAVIGLGCAPIYPSMIHLTPERFGAQNSQKVIGWQMATAYTGATFMPPLVGAIASKLGIRVLPYALVLFAVCMLVLSQMIDRNARKNSSLPPETSSLAAEQ